jgi:hypothetical protein
MRSTLLSNLFFGALIMGLSAASFAADGDPAKQSAAAHSLADTKMTPELKKDMADMYQKMADCMRSDKTLDQCRHEAMTNCPVVKKTGYCPINEGMGKRRKGPTDSMKNGDMSNMK